MDRFCIIMFLDDFAVMIVHVSELFELKCSSLNLDKIKVHSA